MGKIVPHYAVRVSQPHLSADKVSSPELRVAADKAPISDPVGKLVDQLNGILDTGGLGRPLELEGVVAVLALPDDDQAAAVEAALSRAAANGQDVPKLYPLL